MATRRSSKTTETEGVPEEQSKAQPEERPLKLTAISSPEMTVYAGAPFDVTVPNGAEHIFMTILRASRRAHEIGLTATGKMEGSKYSKGYTFTEAREVIAVSQAVQKVIDIGVLVHQHDYKLESWENNKGGSFWSAMSGATVLVFNGQGASLKFNIETRTQDYADKDPAKITTLLRKTAWLVMLNIAADIEPDAERPGDENYEEEDKQRRGAPKRKNDKSAPTKGRKSTSSGKPHFSVIEELFKKFGGWFDSKTELEQAVRQLVSDGFIEDTNDLVEVTDSVLEYLWHNDEVAVANYVQAFSDMIPSLPKAGGDDFLALLEEFDVAPTQPLKQHIVDGMLLAYMNGYELVDEDLEFVGEDDDYRQAVIGIANDYVNQRKEQK